MLKLALLLIGAGDLGRNWRWLLALGLLVTLSGGVILIDTTDHITLLTLEGFGWGLVIKGLLQITFGALSHWGAGFLLYALTGLVSVITGLLIVDFPMQVDFLASTLFGAAFLINGLFQCAAAWVIRFPGWKMAGLSGLEHLALGAVIAYGGWQDDQHWVIPLLLSLGAILWGLSMITTALRLRWIDRSPLSSVPSLLALPQLWSGLLNHRLERFREQLRSGNLDTIVKDIARQADDPAASHLTLYIWTPTDSADAGTAEGPPVIRRYIAAVDAKGTISTGHSALFMPPDIYLSLYPRDDFHPADTFLDDLRSHDVEGYFFSSYDAEVASWMPANVTLQFQRIKPNQLRWFWALFQRDCSYNLTNRNCSVAVALALDVALAGSLGGSNTLWTLVRLMTSRSLWIAALVRRQAEEMVWTPGLLLDYSLAIHRLVEESAHDPLFSLADQPQPDSPA